MTTRRYIFTLDVDDPPPGWVGEALEALSVYGNVRCQHPLSEPATHADAIQSHTDHEDRIAALEAIHCEDTKSQRITDLQREHLELSERVEALELWLEKTQKDVSIVQNASRNTSKALNATDRRIAALDERLEDLCKLVWAQADKLQEHGQRIASMEQACNDAINRVSKLEGLVGS